ncbi:MAG: hypothetical protein IT299_05220 [Dehalococcoidia bacterium]|nr:hypothetical protein [Dehalococcoidia bacterium]
MTDPVAAISTSTGNDWLRIAMVLEGATVGVGGGVGEAVGGAVGTGVGTGVAAGEGVGAGLGEAVGGRGVALAVGEAVGVASGVGVEGSTVNSGDGGGPAAWTGGVGVISRVPLTVVPAIGGLTHAPSTAAATTMAAARLTRRRSSLRVSVRIRCVDIGALLARHRPSFEPGQITWSSAIVSTAPGSVPRSFTIQP